MYHERKAASAYGAEYSLEYEVAEAIQRKRKHGAIGLDQDEAMYDMERMGASVPDFSQPPGNLTCPILQLRDPYRGAYPHMAYDPAYGQLPPHVGMSYGFDYAAHTYASASQHPLAAQGRTVASVPHGNNGRGDPFSAYRMQTGAGASSAAIAQYQQMMGSNHARSAPGHRPTLDDHLAAGLPSTGGRTTTGHKYGGGSMHAGYPTKQDSRTAQAYFPVGYAGI